MVQQNSPSNSNRAATAGAAAENAAAENAAAAGAVTTNAAAVGAVATNAAAISDEQMEEMLQSHLPGAGIRAGNIVQGTIVELDDRRALVDIGQKSEGLVPGKEMHHATMERPLAKGDEVNAYVIRPEKQAGGNPLLSLDRAQGEDERRLLEDSMQSNATLTGRIIDVNRGGLVVVSEAGVRGFVPLSHVTAPIKDALGKEPIDIVQSKKELLETPIQFKVLDFNRRRNKAIFSHRLAVQEQKMQIKQQLIKELMEGQIIEGTVTGISEFGAFVDIGGADGLVHISELSWEPVKHPANVLEVGQKLMVSVLKIDHENLKVALSLKRLSPEPWSNIGDKYQVGQVVDVVITKVVSFGAFARLAPGIEGLIHLSELSHEHVENPQDEVQTGQQVTAVIMKIEEPRRRLALSIKRIREAMEASESGHENAQTPARNSNDGGTEETEE